MWGPNLTSGAGLREGTALKIPSGALTSDTPHIAPRAPPSSAAKPGARPASASASDAKPERASKARKRS